MSARRSAVPLLALWILVAFASLARGDEAPFFLRVDPCVPVRPDVVAQQVAIELGPRHVQSANTIRLEVSCRGTLALLLSYSTRQVFARTLNLSLQPAEIREQILALSLAELFTAHTIYESALEPPRAAPIDTSPRPATQPPAPSRPPLPSLRLLALGSVQSYSNGPLNLFGGGLGLGWDGKRHVGLFVDLLARHGSVSVPRGNIAVDTVSTGVAVLYVHGGTRVRLRAGVGLRGGFVRMRGEPDAAASAVGRTHHGGWLGTALTLGASLHVAQRVVLELLGEGGYVAVPVTGLAFAEPGAAISGAFFGLQLGLGFFP